MQLLSDNSSSNSDYTLTHCSRVLDAHNSKAHTSGPYRQYKLHTTRCFHLHTLCTIPCCSNLNSCTQLQATRSQHTGNCTFAHLYICTPADLHTSTPPHLHTHLHTSTELSDPRSGLSSFSRRPALAAYSLSNQLRNDLQHC